MRTEFITSGTRDGSAISATTRHNLPHSASRAPAQNEARCVTCHEAHQPDRFHPRRGYSWVSGHRRPLERPGRLVFVPRVRRSLVHDVRTVTVRAGATAAGIAAVLMLALGSNALVGSNSPGRTPTSASAYSESMDYELSLIAQQRDRSNGSHMTVAV